MPTYAQLWFPKGEAAGEDAKSGRGAFTRRFISVHYAPPGDSEQPAATFAHFPLDSTGLAVPAVKIESGIYSQGDALLIEKFTQTGAFITGEYRGDDIFSIEGDGDIWNLGTMYAHKANVGGISAAADGATSLNMTLGNLFTCTPTQNTSWSTAAPPGDGIGGQLAVFIVDNSGGKTVAWAAGFTDVEPIAAANTGIHGRLLQFDGTTWHQLAAMQDGVVTNVYEKHILTTILNPLAVQTKDNEVSLWKAVPRDLTITKIGVTLDSAANEVTGDLKYCDAFIGLANPVAINPFDTTNGVLVDSTIAIGLVPSGKCIYLAFDAAPHVDITQMNIDIEFDYN